MSVFSWPTLFSDRDRARYERSLVEEPICRIPASMLSEADEIKRLRADLERLRALLREAVDDMRECDDDCRLIGRIREALEGAA